MTDATHHPPRPTRLQFLSDWRIIRHGEITAGGKIIVEYDMGRLPNFRKRWREADIWNIEIYIRFHPGGQFHKESLLEQVRYSGSGPVIDHLPKHFEIVVPMDATQVELWFRTFDDVGGFREAWDSQFGQNYWFSVTRG